MRRPTRLLLLAALAGCGAGDRSRIGPIEFQGPPGSGEPNLAVLPDGRIALTWFEPAGPAGDALRVAVRDDGTWSAPQTITTGDSFFVNWADFPSLVATPDGRWLVHWLQKVAAAPYAYHVRVAVSHDEGSTWSAPITLHDDASPTEHGFVALVPIDRNEVAATWLDGRETAGNGHASSEAAEGGPSTMTVRFGIIGADGVVRGETLLDDMVCDCCQTALARTGRGLVAAYRDRSLDEIRDIAVVRHVQGGWIEPVIVHPDGWHIAACPVNGPALAAGGDTVALVWYTAADDRPRVQIAFSIDGGAEWTAPLVVDDGLPIGRVDVVMLGGGAALVVWLENVAGAAEVRARTVVRGAREPGDSWVVTRSSAARASGFPRVAGSGDELVFAWTEPGVEGGIRVAAARVVR